MRIPRVTTAGMMAIVMFAAVDCFLIRFWDFFAGGLLTALALQAGLFRLTRTRGRRRRFWVGFEATGLVALLGYIPCHRVFFTEVIVPWTYILFGAFDRAMTHLPYGAFAWYRRYLFINPWGALRIVDLITLQEVAFGFPMLLVASAGGLLAALLARRRAPRSCEARQP